MDSKSMLCWSNVTKLNIPLLTYICTDKDWKATHFLPVVKCTLHLLCHTKRSSIYFQASKEALNWLDGREKADWLAGASLCCFYVVFQDGYWWELNVTCWKSKYRGIFSLSPHILADGPRCDWKYLVSMLDAFRLSYCCSLHLFLTLFLSHEPRDAKLKYWRHGQCLWWICHFTWFSYGY